MKLKHLFAATAVALALASTVASASTCTTTTLAALDNTTCTIGNISFNFSASFESLTGTVVPATNITVTFAAIGNMQFITFTGLPDIPFGTTGSFPIVNTIFDFISATSLPGNLLVGISNIQASALTATGPFSVTQSVSEIAGSAFSSVSGIVIRCDQNGNCMTNQRSVGSTFLPMNLIDETLIEQSVLFGTGSNTGNVATFEFDTIPTGPAVPEPSTLVMMASGLLGAAGALRRRLAS